MCGKPIKSFSHQHFACPSVCMLSTQWALRMLRQMLSLSAWGGGVGTPSTASLAFGHRKSSISPYLACCRGDWGQKRCIVSANSFIPFSLDCYQFHQRTRSCSVRDNHTNTNTGAHVHSSNQGVIPLEQTLPLPGSIASWRRIKGYWLLWKRVEPIALKDQDQAGGVCLCVVYVANGCETTGK